MAASEFNLEWLVYPLELPRFWREYWEQKPYLVERKDCCYYLDLLSLEDVDSLLPLVGSAANQERLRLVKSDAGTRLNRPVFYNSRGALDVLALYQSYQEGYTIIANGIDFRWQPVARLCRRLEALLQCPVAANLYLTPRQAQGFAPHFDTHDVFILQLNGQKSWRIYEAKVSLPLIETNDLFVEDDLGEPVDEVMLNTGDALYIPRGYVHEALTLEVSSLHLTLGIHVVRWMDLISEALKIVAEQDACFREAAPTFDLESQEAIACFDFRLQELVNLFAQQLKKCVPSRRLLQHLNSFRQPVPDGHFVSLDSLDRLTLRSAVSRRFGMCCTVSMQDDSTSIQFLGKQIVGPVAIEPALRFIAHAKSFMVGELPDCLTDDAKLVLARRLVKEGLLRIEHQTTREEISHE